MNAKFRMTQKGQFLHFWRIPDSWTEIWKYASFERVRISQNPWFYRILGTKKALLKSAKTENSRTWKSGFLVQNVKNQFLHKLPWRGIWVV